ncbi:MAG: hypothetical protein DMG12_01205 [Acidobacteria bacterium]|nr:MAG: hypothetical protein DMG12_01205 [Acidobacteriota bacterium]
MIKQFVIASAAALALLMIGAPARAHHSANAEFDTQKQFTITGVLTKIENVNPHSWWYVDVKGPDGKTQSWMLESLSPRGLILKGLKVKTELHLGDTYSFRISPALKDPDPKTKLGFMRSITVNGKEYVVIEL